MTTRRCDRRTSANDISVPRLVPSCSSEAEGGFGGRLHDDILGLGLRHALPIGKTIEGLDNVTPTDVYYGVHTTAPSKAAHTG